MKCAFISTLAAICAIAFGEPAAPVPDAAIVTDPTKIINSTTYDLGDRQLTVQELTKEALPIQQPLQPAAAPATPRPIFRPQKISVLPMHL